MKIFSYSDYIKCIHTLRLNAVLQLAEEKTDYQFEQARTKNRHDKLVKNILKDETEMAKLVNGFLQPNQRIKSKNLEKYTNSYITKKYYTKEADLVYKLKDEEIFFLVEHQSTIDNKMPYRILNYCIDIMQEWSKTNKNKSRISYPIVVPIVIYTGIEKWKIPKNFREKQISSLVFERYKIGLEYNLIEINKFSNQFLLQKQSLFGYSMILEKSKNKEQLKQNLELIIDHIKDKKQLEEIENMIYYLLKDSLEESTQFELLKKIESKIREGENNVSSLYERLTNEFRQDLRKEKKEGEKIATIKICKKLIMYKVQDEIIKQSTNLTQKQLDKLKASILIKK